MPINPLISANKIADDFRRYLLSTFPLADLDLAEQARAFLSSKTSLEMPLIKRCLCPWLRGMQTEVRYC